MKTPSKQIQAISNSLTAVHDNADFLGWDDSPASEILRNLSGVLEKELHRLYRAETGDDRSTWDVQAEIQDYLDMTARTWA